MSLNLEKKLFCLPQKVLFEDQKKILKFIVENGYNAPESSEDCIWKAYRFRILDRTKIPEEYFNDFSKANMAPDFWSRHRCDLPWVWQDTPVTDILMRYADQLSPYIHNLTRVLAVVLKPSKEILLHRDLIGGSEYGKIKCFSPYPDYEFLPNQFHKNNDYLSVKMPLTEIEGDNGFPYIEKNGSHYSYDVKNNFFAINEVHIKHGAKPCSHYRGAMFFDGNLNLPELYDHAIRFKLENDQMIF